MTIYAVVPDPFARIALLPRDASSVGWARIAAPTAPDVVLTGTVINITASDVHIAAISAGAAAAPVLVNVNAFLAPPGQQPFSVTVGALPVSEPGPVTLAKSVSCAEGCRLTGPGVVDAAGPTGPAERDAHPQRTGGRRSRSGDRTRRPMVHQRTGYRFTRRAGPWTYRTGPGSG